MKLLLAISTYTLKERAVLFITSKAKITRPSSKLFFSKNLIGNSVPK